MGTFTTAGGIQANDIAHWDGNAWSALGAGVNGTVRALTVLPNGELVVGGDFTTAGGATSAFIARRGYPFGCPACPADFNEDGVADFFDYLDFVGAFDAEHASADFNRDRAVDFFDYLDFVAAWDAESPAADVNADGTIDFFDYLDFVAEFDAGC